MAGSYFFLNKGIPYLFLSAETGQKVKESLHPASFSQGCRCETAQLEYRDSGYAVIRQLEFSLLAVFFSGSMTPFFSFHDQTDTGITADTGKTLPEAACTAQLYQRRKRSYQSMSEAFGKLVASQIGIFSPAVLPQASIRRLNI